MGFIGYLRTKFAVRTRLRRGMQSWKNLHYLRENGFVGKGKDRKLSNVTFYGTNLCDSRCKHCGIWEQRPVLYLDEQIYQDVHDSPATDENTVFGFEGGEFTLIKNADRILDMYQGRKIELYSNCLKPQKTIKLCRDHNVPNLIVSLDGRKDTYKEMRGVDGFDRVIEVCTAMAKEREVAVSYTIAPWNNYDDFCYVREFCHDNGITFGVNILHNSVFFENDFKFEDIPDEQDDPFFTEMNRIKFAEAGKEEEIMPGDHPVKQNYLFGYNRWLQKKELLPCTSIFHRIVVYPNGDVPLCQQGTTGILGNLYARKLEDIWYDAKTLQHQKAHKKCNKCWISYHRFHDLMAYEDMLNIMPRSWIDAWMKRGKKPQPHNPSSASPTSQNPAGESCS